MITFLTNDQKQKELLAELAAEIPAANALSISVHFEKNEACGLSVRGEGGDWYLSYSDTASLFRGVALTLQRAAAGEMAEVHEEPLFDTLGVTVDMTENAVMKPSAVKRFCRLLATLGYNALTFKTVKGGCISETLDFDGFAGRYSAEEMRELDAYAASLGIDLIPCIQFSEIAAYPSSERFEAAIDRALQLCSDNLRSRKVCFGFDRPALPGCGPYPAPSGNCTAEELPHDLKILARLCEKHGLTASMGGGVLDSAEKTDLPFAFAVSECTSVDPNVYRAHLEKIAQKTDNFAFVGGDNGWYGAVPLSWLSHTVACNTMPALRERPPREVHVAMWREDTGACSYFATLPVLFAYAETCWARTDYTEHLSRRMLALCGVDFYDMVPLEDIPAIRCRLNTGRVIVTPGRYMLYDRVLPGDFAAHSGGGLIHLRSMTDWMAERIERAGEFAYIFETQVAFCDLLACKAEISEGSRRAYRKGWHDKLRQIYDSGFEKAIEAVDRFVVKLRAQWERECMDFGMELIESRMELVKSRIMADKPLLGAYFDGKLENPEFLSPTPKPYAHEEGLIHDREALLLNDFETIIKGND
ncbi:MAG: hypothetical protein IKJ35_09255 [Clostridia bacterium]|nr:hypothetical protein [Clostridia bacterium]